mgnify:CR=1 FL=1
MEKIVILQEHFAGASFKRSGGFISRYSFFAAHDYKKQAEAVRFFEIKGKNKAKRAEAFIEKAFADGLTVETFNGYGERVKVCGIE